MKKELGQRLPLLTFRGQINPQYNTPLFVQAISDCDRLLHLPETEILFEGRNRIGVVRIPLDKGESLPVVIKKFHSQGLNKLKSLVWPTKAFKSWRGAAILLEKKIDTPVPVAYLEKRRRFFLEQSYYLAEEVEENEEIRYLFLRLPPVELRKLLVSLAQHLFICHRKGVLHRDLSDGNILIKKERQGKIRFYLIDTNRIRFKRRIGRWRGIKNLVRLGVPSTHQSFFLKQYLQELRVKKRDWLWYTMNKKIYSFFIELKKKLKLRELARKLRIQ